MKTRFKTKSKTKSKSKSKPRAYRRSATRKPIKNMASTRAVNLPLHKLYRKPVLYKTLYWSHMGYLTITTHASQVWKINSLYDPNYTASIAGGNNETWNTNTTVRGLTDMSRRYKSYQVQTCKATINFQNVSNMDLLVQVTMTVGSPTLSFPEVGVIPRLEKSVSKVVMRSVAGNRSSYGQLSVYVPMASALKKTKTQFHNEYTDYEEGLTYNSYSVPYAGGLTNNDTGVIASATEPSDQEPRETERVYLFLRAYELKTGGHATETGIYNELASIVDPDDKPQVVDVAQYGDSGQAHVFSEVGSLFYNAKFQFFTRFCEALPLPNVEAFD